MTAVRGTREQRQQAQQLRTRRKRAAEFAVRIRTATTGRALLWHACNFALAVGRDLTDTGRRELARQIVALVDERNPIR